MTTFNARVIRTASTIMSRPVHCHGHSTTLIIPKITAHDRYLEKLKTDGVPCPHKKCGGFNMSHWKFCGKCKRRIKQNATMKKAGKCVKIK